MEKKTNETWYYVIVQSPDMPDEEFVGFYDEKTQEKFIPAFKTQEQAKACFQLMPKDIFKSSYDTQAVIEEDLLQVAEKGGHRVYLLDEQGRILDYVN